ncbi:MAG: addiction module protein [Acidobacteria bacterium]|nr:addiction module protein [Acidobacteriota bacterium]
MGTTIDISSLGVEQRLLLLEEIWDSLSESPEAFQLTAAQEAELNRRADEIDAGDTSGTPWEEVVENIRNKHKSGVERK